MKESPAKIDAILEPLVDASDDQADELLLQIINVHAEPVIKGVIRFKLRLNTAQRAEGDDIYQEVVLQLLAQLQKFRKVPDGHPIGDLRGMAAVIARRTCARWLRRQFPERHALRTGCIISSHGNAALHSGKTTRANSSPVLQRGRNRNSQPGARRTPKYQPISLRLPVASRWLTLWPRSSTTFAVQSNSTSGVSMPLLLNISPLSN